MFNAIVVFSKRLNDDDINRVRDLTSAISVEMLNCDKIGLSKFAEYVLGKEEFIEIEVHRLRGVDSLVFLASSELCPVMFFHDVDGILATIENHGDVVSHIKGAISSVARLDFATDYICEGKKRLGMTFDQRAIHRMLDEMRPKFEADLDEVISRGRDYYALVSQVEF